MDAKDYFQQFSKFVDSQRRLNLPLSIEFLRRCSNRETMAHLLEETANDMEKWSSDSSYEHNNGFLKISLLKTQFMHARLHIWHKPEESTIHNHGWDFVSCGVDGEIEFRNFFENKKGSIYDKTILREKHDEDTGALIKKESVAAGQSRLTLTSIYTLLPFGLHAIDYNTPHQSQLMTPNAVSLIITGPPVAYESSIFEQNKKTRTNQYNILDIEQKREAVLKVVSDLRIDIE